MRRLTKEKKGHLEYFKEDFIGRKPSLEDITEEYIYAVQKMKAAGLLHDIDLAIYYEEMVSFLGVQMLVRSVYLN